MYYSNDQFLITIQVFFERLYYMHYQVIPLFYAANEYFKNTIHFCIELIEEVDPDALQYAAAQAQIRYPYYSVKIIREKEEYVLAENDLPFVISESPVCLNSAESNYHLVAFSAKDRTISVDISHFICDGNGLAPLVKTLMYYYIEHRYGTEGIDTSSIRLVSDPVLKGEYQYPFPDQPIPQEEELALQPKAWDPFVFADSFFDPDGSYAYNLQVKQKDLMHYAKANDGSPLSFISVMMYKALMALFPEQEKDVVFMVPHEYRAALAAPLSHESLARVFYVVLRAKDQAKDIELLNTAVRGQVILGSDVSEDFKAINGLIQLGAYFQTLSLNEKKKTMIGIISNTITPHTFGISYTGKVEWGGMEAYIRDVHPYAGEKRFSGLISAEIFTLGEFFTITLFQPGRNPAFAQEVMNAFATCGIDCRLTSEERYQLSGFMIPE